MSKLEEIEDAVAGLGPAELARFRAWFAEFDASLFDEAIDRTARDGKLDRLAEAALAEFAQGRTSKL